MELNRENTRAILKIIAFTLLLLALLLHLNKVMGLLLLGFRTLSFFFLGLLLAFLLGTLLSLVEDRLLRPIFARLPPGWAKARRTLCVCITLLIILGILLMVVFMMLPALSETFTLLGEQLPGFLADMNAWFQRTADGTGRSLDALRMPRLDWVKIGDAALLFLTGAGENLLSGTFGMASSLVSGMVNLAIGFVVAVYILLTKEKLKDQAERLLAAYLTTLRSERLLAMGSLVGRVFRNFITGQCLEAMILGSLCFAGMHLLRFPFAPVVSVLLGVMAFIPIFGGVISLAIGAFMILVNSGPFVAGGFILFILILQQVEGNFIYPHVVGKRVKLPGLWVLCAVTLGGKAAGILGMFLGVPIASVLYALLREAVRMRLQMQGTDGPPPGI